MRLLIHTMATIATVATKIASRGMALRSALIGGTFINWTKMVSVYEGYCVKRISSVFAN